MSWLLAGINEVAHVLWNETQVFDRRCSLNPLQGKRSSHSAGENSRDVRPTALT